MFRPWLLVRKSKTKTRGFGSPGDKPPAMRTFSLRATAGCTTAAVVSLVPSGAEGGEVIAKSGDVFVGRVDHPDGTATPAIWTATSGSIVSTDLGARGAWRYGSAVGVDAAGDVLVVYRTANSVQTASYLVRGSRWPKLVSPVGMTDSFAEPVTANGYVVVDEANRFNRDGTLAQVEVVVWLVGQARWVSLRALFLSSTFVAALAVNGKHDVVGVQSSLGSPPSVAVVWPNGAEPLRGPSLEGGPIVPWAVNVDGMIAGRSTGRAPHAAVAVPFGPIRDLGTLPGDVTSYAWGVNDAGAVVGDSFASGHSYRAFYWTSAGGMRPLRSPAAGQSAVAWGLDSNGIAWGESTNPSAGESQPTVWSCIAVTPASARQTAGAARESKTRAMADGQDAANPRAVPAQTP